MAAIKNTWQRKPLGSVAEVVSGYAFKSSEFCDHGIPVIKIKNIRVGYVDLTETDYVDPKYLTIPERFHVRNGDVLISLTGSHISQPNSVVGRVARHAAGQPDCLLNQRGGKVIIKNRCNCDSAFLFYALSEEESVQAIAMLAHGAANQANVSPTQVESVKVPLPPLPVQQRIAGILSAYDELIENNQRRIKILEQMARNLYREWFVLFRFPARKSVNFVETQFGKLPEDWVLPFADHVDFKEGPGLRNWQYRKEGLPFLNIRTLVDNDIDLAKVQFLDPKEVEEKYQHFLLRENDHVVSSSGTIGRIVTIRAEHLPLMLNTSIIRMRPQGERMGCWLLKHFMLSDYFQNQAMSFAIGAAQANFGPIHLKQMKIIAPDERTTAEYERLVAPMEFTIMSLARKIQNLRKARDLLLPRLLSGQINVN